jgi:hypothetical protein
MGSPFDHSPGHMDTRRQSQPNCRHHLWRLSHSIARQCRLRSRRPDTLAHRTIPERRQSRSWSSKGYQLVCQVYSYGDDEAWC